MRMGVGSVPQTGCTGEPPGMSLQVQLLISAQDVENYKVIKSELDKLRTMVEKSELWVDKKGSVKGDSTGDGNKKEKKEVRALSKVLGGQRSSSLQSNTRQLSVGHAHLLGKGPVGCSCGPGFGEVWRDSDAASVPSQHTADEEVIAPGEKSSENYQIVKGVSGTENCPQGWLGHLQEGRGRNWGGTSNLFWGSSVH